MTQIELQRRYPDSRPEDITDAYTRGFEVGLAMRADENAELRKELAVTNPLFETLNAANDRLIYENMKLRELVRKVEHYEQLGCHDCPHGGSCAVDTLYDEGCAMSREIEFEKRKLGIEVDA